MGWLVSLLILQDNVPYTFENLQVCSLGQRVYAPTRTDPWSNKSGVRLALW